MKLKVNFPRMESTGDEMKHLAHRMQAIAEEMQIARFSLLGSEETFWREAFLTARKIDKLEREAAEMNALADALFKLIELYAECERKQERRGTVFPFLKYKVVLPPILIRKSESSCIRPEQIIAAFEKLIAPLLGVL